MQKLTGLERILRTVKHQEPDRVPHFEMLIDKKVRDAITRDSSATYEDFIEKMDLDAVVIFDKTWTWTYEVVDAARGIRRDQWGSLVQSTTTDLGYVVEPAIKSKKDIDTYVPPNPDDSWRYEYLRRLVKRWKGQRAIIAHCTDVFETARASLIGEVPYFEAMVEAPEVCEWANSIVADYNLRFFRNCVDEGADIIMVSGDWAMTEQPMVSRTHTKRFLIPAFRKIVDLAHSRGVPCFKHSDGNIMPIFDLVVDAGADGIHPIDPMAGMDMAECKARFGRKICLMGNVSCAFSLVTGTTDEVRKETKEVIRRGGKGGGLICMSSNTIHSGVKPENYVAMIKAIKEYGKYPLEDHFDNLVMPGSGAI